MAFVSNELVLEEEHLACKCQCTVQEKHCNSLQMYNKSQCRCQCTNNDDMTKCIKVSKWKITRNSFCLYPNFCVVFSLKKIETPNYARIFELF